MMIKEQLGKIIDKLIYFKYQLDLGYSFLGYVNFILLLITASGHIIAFLANFGVKLELSQLVIISVPFMIFCIWFMGFFMDVVVQYPQRMSKEGEGRSRIVLPYLQSIDERTKKIAKELKIEEE